MSEVSEEPKTKVDSSGELSDVDNDNCSSNGSGSSSGGETKRTCVDCGTFRTPLWRGGPAGPKSLCNACGIKSRKKRQAALGIKPEKKNKRSISSDTSDLSLDDGNKTSKDDDHSSKCTSSSSKRMGRFLDLGFKVPVMKRSPVEKKRLWSKLGEEERAAVLLMALSCGSVFA
ncbi:GATA transcription factor 17 [Raphanus sativus]|uniref:GATA transcription factor 17 n=1 Tax=Raphanus sativus TaxID=3726 RepID=A0A6J0LUK0_RAPSA|nr:GATA transcription factor 17 [Raphanus sativus]KAJ4893811.1 GATA transcription factor 17 [Raphanus sativus]